MRVFTKPIPIHKKKLFDLFTAQNVTLRFYIIILFKYAKSLTNLTEKCISKELRRKK